MDFNNLYKLGYARSRQLPATVHRNEKVIEKCHSNSALRKEGGTFKKMDKIRPRTSEGMEHTENEKNFFAKQTEQHRS